MKTTNTKMWLILLCFFHDIYNTSMPTTHNNCCFIIQKNLYTGYKRPISSRYCFTHTSISSLPGISKRDSNFSARFESTR